MPLCSLSSGISGNLKKIAFLSLLCSLLTTVGRAQELVCKVSIMHAAIRNTDPQVFKSMEQAITEFMNGRKWTSDEFLPEERIPVNILINLTDKSGEDVFGGRMTINASRPVYNTSYTSPTVNFQDQNVSFRYSQFAPINFDDNRVAGNDPLAANLTAVLAYYTYLILGLDYDSFAPNGGDALFKKAQSVVANAPEGSGIKGWTAAESQTNRYWIVDQLLNPRFRTFRQYWYDMHRQGLDLLYSKPEQGRGKILEGIQPLAQLQKDNPGNILLLFFFSAKSDEFVKILSQTPRDSRTPYINALITADQNGAVNTRKYESLR